MKQKITLLLITIFILSSCERNSDKQFSKDILGEWTYIKTEDQRKPLKNKNYNYPPPAPYYGRYIPGYIFSENNICENKTGYFHRIESDQRKDRKIIFLGTKTKYKIENDSLKILDLLTKTWESQKIHSIIGDTLTTTTGDSLFAKYARAKHKINPNENYDKIIVSSSGCYGSCPISDISIDNKGNIFFYGQDYTSKIGIYTSKITKNEFQQIQTNFKKAGIINLENNYEANHSDDEAITMTFVKNNKIVKTISDYGRKSPATLIWAYTPVRFLYQHIKLVPYRTEEPILSIFGAGFTKGNQICDLSKSESFYLFTEIYKGKETTQKFENKYQIIFWNSANKKETIYTDGRYFKCRDKIVDIGYNFLTQNNLTENFRPKIKYDY
ncbi:DUF6438 domain-containing protein [Flavobacterium artemisiae]|uniref:DUF6438 domain-containing protein n=1 Tax=Flavobacterium artemisiae TaxID=2126556 RepID=A0ABW4H993_9FLAO